MKCFDKYARILLGSLSAIALSGSLYASEPDIPYRRYVHDLFLKSDGFVYPLTRPLCSGKGILDGGLRADRIMDGRVFRNEQPESGTDDYRKMKVKGFGEVKGSLMKEMSELDSEILGSVPKALGILTDSLLEIPREFVRRVDAEEGSRIRLGRLRDIDIPEVVGYRLVRNVKEEVYRLVDSIGDGGVSGFVFDRFAEVIRNSNVDVRDGRLMIEPCLKEGFARGVDVGGYKIQMNGLVRLEDASVHPSLSVGISPGFKTDYPFNIRVNLDSRGNKIYCRGITFDMKNSKINVNASLYPVKDIRVSLSLTPEDLASLF